MDQITYPGRPQFFAHKFCRLMVKTCLCQELGTGAFALLATIAHTEDAAHYRRAVTWFNSQLESVLGMSRDQLIRVRAKCVDGGWLYYKPGSKGRAGRYWVIVPRYAEGLDDLPTDEGTDDFPSQIQTESTMESRLQTRRNPDCKPAPFNPVPVPDPKEGAVASAESEKRKRTTKNPGREAITIPDELDNTEARQALEDWQQHRKELRKNLTPSAEQSLLRKWSKIGPARFIAAVEHSIGNGWLGIFEPKTNCELREGQPADADDVMAKHTAEVLSRKRAAAAANGGPTS